VFTCIAAADSASSTCHPGLSDESSAMGLAICVADFTEDGSLDIFVANDTTPNSLYANRSFQGFDDKAIPTGVAVSSDGTHGASMGAACGDYNRDGHFDLLVLNFRNQSNDLFEGLGSSGFIPSSSRTTIDMSSRWPLGLFLMTSTWTDGRTSSLPIPMDTSGICHPTIATSITRCLQTSFRI
jgi:hypothetical protein